MQCDTMTWWDVMQNRVKIKRCGTRDEWRSGWVKWKEPLVSRRMLIGPRVIEVRLSAETERRGSQGMWTTKCDSSFNCRSHWAKNLWLGVPESTYRTLCDYAPCTAGSRKIQNSDAHAVEANKKGDPLDVPRARSHHRRWARHSQKARSALYLADSRRYKTE